jgi:hypothetical protein
LKFLYEFDFPPSPLNLPMAEGTWVPPPKDWTETYQYWDKCDVEDEEVQQAQKMSEQRMRNYLESPGAFMGHDHDHSVERKLLEKSEPEKMAYCENHRRLGNYLFLESIFPKAAEQYQLALSYYEYCFPTDEATMQELDDVRHACLCNISLCYYRMKQWRLAVQAATEVLQEDAGNVKALYRRAQAHRALDEYEYVCPSFAKVVCLCVHLSHSNRPTNPILLGRGRQGGGTGHHQGAGLVPGGPRHHPRAPGTARAAPERRQGRESRGHAHARGRAQAQGQGVHGRGPRGGGATRGVTPLLRAVRRRRQAAAAPGRGSDSGAGNRSV